jgi:hypothetical protein
VLRLSRQVVLLLGCLIGLALWLVPAGFMNQPEPWDGSGPAYPLALLASGLLLGLLAPGNPGTIVASVFLGQLAVLIWRVVASPENSALWLVGVVMLAGYTFVATGLGALLGGLLRRRISPELRSVDRRATDRRV